MRKKKAKTAKAKNETAAKTRKVGKKRRAKKVA